MAEKSSSVKISKQTVNIPTYKIGKPDKNPMFLEKRVYQGSSGVVYPHPVIESISDYKKDQPWDVVFLDVRLPDLSGPDVFAEISRMQPELKHRVVFVTGGLWRQESRLHQKLAGQRVLPKPCTQEQVREVLRSLAPGNTEDFLPRGNEAASHVRRD